MVIGEAPGATEVEEGRPFVGPSGNMLDQAFKLLDVQREYLYITNVVKVWPRTEEGKTRRPNEDELAVWRPILDYELEQCAPAAILLLGRTAADSYGWSPGDVEMGVFAAWHPAYLFHFPAKFDEWTFQLNPWARALHLAQNETGRT